jgi:hypothetical protein
MQGNNYSVDMMKKMAFIDEINNYLKLRIKQLQDDDPLGNIREIDKLDNILYYFEQRVTEFDKRNK